MTFIITFCRVQCKTLDSIRHRLPLPSLLRLTTVFEPRIFVRVKRVLSHLLAVFERIDVKHPAAVFAVFYLTTRAILLEPHTRVVGIGVEVVEITDEPVNAIGELELVRVGERRAAVLGPRSVGLREEIGGVEACE
jgi:hypothetical protein